MITRNQARKALAELQQQSAQTVPLVKPLQLVEGIANVAKKMQIISLNSDGEQHDSTELEVGVVILLESPESVTDTLSSDETVGDESDVSEEEDGDDSEEEGAYEHVKEKSSSSPAGDLLAEEVIRLIKGDDLKELKVDNCRSYLRHHGLRVTGTKPVLIDRIKQHIELKEGGCKNYDRTTFSINCTGDVCKGDVVMFDQMVYEKYDVSSRSAAAVGRRTVAGRVVKESYGAQRQQHTFTVEVLWSSGCTPLPPMKQLLVKGRNLYKRRTFRQRWADEGERRKSLDEKHERGAAARYVRATKQGRFKGYPGTLGPEVQQMKQLANPYTNTVGSKENSNYGYGPVFESAVAIRHAVAVTSQHHVVHSHCTLATKDKARANDVTGRYRGAPQSFGVNVQSASFSSSYYDQIHNFQADRNLSASSTGECTSPNKRRQWFKPVPPLITSDSQNKQQRCASHIMPPLVSDDSRTQQKSAPPIRPSLVSGDSRMQQRYAPPLRPSMEPRPPVISKDSHMQQNCASPIRSSESRPPPVTGDSQRQRYGSPIRPLFESRSPLISGDSHKQQKCASPIRPSYDSQRQRYGSPIRPSSDSQSQRYGSPIRPSYDSQSQRHGSPIRPSCDSQSQRHGSPIRSSSESTSRMISGDADKQQRCASPMRPSFESRPWVTSGDSNRQQSCGASPLRPSFVSRWDQQGSQNLRTGFPCPTPACPNRGSRYCSSGVCYYCCKGIGAPCPNPNHRPT